MFFRKAKAIELLEETLNKKSFEIERLNSNLKNQKKIAYDLNEELIVVRGNLSILEKDKKELQKELDSMKRSRNRYKSEYLKLKEQNDNCDIAKDELPKNEEVIEEPKEEIKKEEKTKRKYTRRKKEEK